uniref:Uncharacterized protein n=1 Tax=Photinus pyralis TaxID=7054 RepID=A0A1Y1K189_PHOPY
MSSQRYRKNIRKGIPATSTPYGRLSPNKSNKSISPILIHKQQASDLESDSSSSSSDSLSAPRIDRNFECESLPRKNININKSQSNLKVDTKYMPTVALCFVIVVGVFTITYAAMSSNNMECTFISIEEIQEKFPSQPQSTFNAIVSGVSEIKAFNKPSIFLFLYDSDTRQTINDLTLAIADYASGILNDDCTSNPIILTSSALSTKTDYGTIISTYKPDLEERKVMIVKNLNQIPGTNAQAFHSICDEYSPLVPKSLIMFTVEVKKSNKKYKSDYEHVEEILKESWSDLDDDIFYPLFTRITSMVLKVQPTNTENVIAT